MNFAKVISCNALLSQESQHHCYYCPLILPLFCKLSVSSVCLGRDQIGCERYLWHFFCRVDIELDIMERVREREWEKMMRTMAWHSDLRYSANWIA